MHFLCKFFGETDFNSTYRTSLNISGLPANDSLLDEARENVNSHSGPQWTFSLVIVRIVTPNLCIVGIIGNSLNIAIITKRVGNLMSLAFLHIRAIPF